MHNRLCNGKANESTTTTSNGKPTQATTSHQHKQTTKAHTSNHPTSQTNKQNNHTNEHTHKKKQTTPCACAFASPWHGPLLGSHGYVAGRSVWVAHVYGGACVLIQVFDQFKFCMCVCVCACTCLNHDRNKQQCTTPSAQPVVRNPGAANRTPAAGRLAGRAAALAAAKICWGALGFVTC